MSQIIKAFTGMFVILVMSMTAFSFLGGFLEVIHAQNLHLAMITELENSDYARSVFEECFQKASENGYTLKMTLYDGRTGVCEYDSIAELPADTANIRMAGVELGYVFSVDFLQVKIPQELFGYAR